MSTVGESIVAVVMAGGLAVLSSRRWAWLATIVLTCVLLLIAVVGLFAQQAYFSMRCAAFAMVFAAAAAHDRRWIAVAVGAGGVSLALVSATWLIATGGTVTFVGESVDPSQRGFVVDTADVTSGFVSTIIVCMVAAVFAFRTARNN